MIFPNYGTYVVTKLHTYVQVYVRSYVLLQMFYLIMVVPSLKQVPHITKIYGHLTDQNCADCIIINFSASVTHPYMDMWPRLSLVLSFSPDYLNNQKPIGIWNSQNVLIVNFSEHNCSKWNYIDSQITFKQLNGNSLHKLM